MSYYFSANIKIENFEEYQKYIAGAGAIFKKYNGKYLAVDDTPQLLEGNWNYTRAVLIKFKTKTDFEDWYYSNEYQNLLKHRLKAAICNTILIKGNHA